jgi:hypothetical protein
MYVTIVARFQRFEFLLLLRVLFVPIAFNLRWVWLFSMCFEQRRWNHFFVEFNFDTDLFIFITDYDGILIFFMY